MGIGVGELGAHGEIVSFEAGAGAWQRHPSFQDLEGPALAWYREAVNADWAAPADVKARFGTASILKREKGTRPVNRA